jgi:hypothetical protein
MCADQLLSLIAFVMVSSSGRSSSRLLPTEVGHCSRSEEGTLQLIGATSGCEASGLSEGVTRVACKRTNSLLPFRSLRNSKIKPSLCRRPETTRRLFRMSSVSVRRTKAPISNIHSVEGRPTGTHFSLRLKDVSGSCFQPNRHVLGKLAKRMQKRPMPASQSQFSKCFIFRGRLPR